MTTNNEATTGDQRTWSLYFDNPRELVDIRDDGPDPTGAIGSNWQYGYTREEAEVFLAKYLADGYNRGSYWASRF